MTTAESIVEQYKQLPDNERETVFMGIVSVNASEYESKFSNSESAHIEGVLKDRMNGSFVPFEPDWAEKMKTRLIESQKKRDLADA